jgi:hypothetical protein
MQKEWGRILCRSRDQPFRICGSLLAGDNLSAAMACSGIDFALPVHGSGSKAEEFWNQTASSKETKRETPSQIKAPEAA